jgi:hypothetical protein
MSSIINYEDLDSLINALYDYEITNPNMYRLDYIPKHEIQMWQYKKHKNFSWEHVFNDCEFDYIGKKKQKELFKRQSKLSKPVVLKIGFYDKNDIDNITHPLNINLTITYVLNELVASKENKFIQYMIAAFDVPTDKLKIYDVIWKNIKQYAGKIAQIQVVEGWFKGATMKEILKNIDSKKSKNLIFQVLYSLAKIQEKWPFFQHNSLDLDAFDVYIKKQSGDYKKLILGSSEFKFIEAGFELKMCGFDKSSIPGFVDNPAAQKSEDPTKDHKNFLKSIRDYVPKDVKEFIDDIVNSKLTPRDILSTNVFFAEYRESESQSRMIGHKTPKNKNNKNKSYRKKKPSYGYETTSSEMNIESSITEASSSMPQHLARNMVYPVSENSDGSEDSNHTKKSIINGSRKFNVPVSLKSKFSRQLGSDDENNNSTSIGNNSPLSSPLQRIDGDNIKNHNNVIIKDSDENLDRINSLNKKKLKKIVEEDDTDASIERYTQKSHSKKKNYSSDESESSDSPYKGNKSDKKDYKALYNELRGQMGQVDNEYGRQAPQQPDKNRFGKLFGEMNIPKGIDNMPAEGYGMMDEGNMRMQGMSQAPSGLYPQNLMRQPSAIPQPPSNGLPKVPPEISSQPPQPPQPPQFSQPLPSQPPQPLPSQPPQMFQPQHPSQNIDRQNPYQMNSYQQQMAVDPRLYQEQMQYDARPYGYGQTGGDFSSARQQQQQDRFFF